MERKVKEITLVESICFIMLFVVAFLYGSGVLGNDKVPMAMTMLFCTVIIAAYSMFILHISWKDLNDSILAAIGKAMPSIILLMMVGLLSASWLACGTTPAMIYYGLKIINPKIFYLAAFLICAMSSNLSGSSWSTVATFGLAFYGISEGLGMPPLITVGAVICGAFIGDKWSPMSDSTNLCAALTNTDVFDLFVHLFPTNGIATVLTAIVYLFFGFKYAGQAKDLTAVTQYADQIKGAFSVNIILFLPIVLVIALSIMRKPTLPILILSVCSSVALGIMFQGESISSTLTALWKGFKLDTGDAAFDSLFTGGGLLNVGECVFIMFIALCLAGVLERTQAMQVIANSLSGLGQNRASLVSLGLVTGIFGTFLGATSYTGMIMVTSMYAPMFKKAGMSDLDLARVAVSSGLVSFLVPWGSSHNLIKANLGVSAAQFGPYSLILWFVLILNIVFSFTGWFYKESDDTSKVASTVTL